MATQPDDTIGNGKYKEIFDHMINGCALHKIVVDDKGKPIDYIFLEVNASFEKQTSLKATDIIGKKVTQVLKGIKNDETDWIGIYGKVALKGQSIQFENYSGPLHKWFMISAYSPSPGQFVTIFQDITDKKRQEEELRFHTRELERFNEIAVGREMKMIELKNRIKELEEQLHHAKD